MVDDPLYRQKTDERDRQMEFARSQLQILDCRSRSGFWFKTMADPVLTLKYLTVFLGYGDLDDTREVREAFSYILPTSNPDVPANTWFMCHLGDYDAFSFTFAGESLVEIVTGVTTALVDIPEELRGHARTGLLSGVPWLKGE